MEIKYFSQGHGQYTLLIAICYSLYDVLNLLGAKLVKFKTTNIVSICNKILCSVHLVLNFTKVNYKSLVKTFNV